MASFRTTQKTCASQMYTVFLRKTSIFQPTAFRCIEITPACQFRANSSEKESKTLKTEPKKEKKSYITDRTLMYGTSAESQYSLGKHRSNALELVMKQPINYVDGPVAVCDGGGGGLGHPVEYISVANIGGAAKPCVYCGLRFAERPH
mmetsp:Transcript_10433/g.12693  ORF Transcript_10433/g.12693 Transcript_10433/m.12693 type:complete len:148 (-) Transcript_10433:548-991(-)